MIMVLGPTKKKAEARAERAADKARRHEADAAESVAPADDAASTSSASTTSTDTASRDAANSETAPAPDVTADQGA